MIDQAIEILRLTRDGNDLAPKHLALVELAANGNLSPAGETAFLELYQAALSGYKKPWHCDVEHVTKDLHGFIYWRGIELEHFSYRKFEDEKRATRDLSDTCLSLEASGIEVNGSTYFRALTLIPA